jgi:hypothetical protein
MDTLRRLVGQSRSDFEWVILRIEFSASDTASAATVCAVCAACSAAEIADLTFSSDLTSEAAK